MSRPALLLAITGFLKDQAALEKAWSAWRNDPGGLGRTLACVNPGRAESRVLMLGRERVIAGLKEKE